MSSFVPASSTFSPFLKKDIKYDISIFTLIISFVTFCALSTFCWVIFAINFTGWFFVTVLGGTVTKFFKSFNGKKDKVENMLDHRLNSAQRFNHFEEFRLSKDINSLPRIPSYRSSIKSNKTSSNSNKINSILSLDFSFSGLSRSNNNNGSSNNNNKPDKNKIVLAPFDYSLKRNEKRTKNIHVPDIPSQLGPNRQKEEWKSNVNYYPSERHSHQPKSKLSVTEKMIESTAAYRVGKKCNGWINGDAEEYAIKNQQKDSTTDCTNFSLYDDPFHSREPIKDLNVRLDQERPKITKQERRTYNRSPASSLQNARQYLTVLLTVKREMNL